MPLLSHNQEVLLTRQRHEAEKAGLHYDIRMVVGDLAYSWATKKEIPEVGKSIILWEQPVHDRTYALSKKVVIPSGQYGAGVTTLDWVKKGTINNPEEDPTKFTLTTKRGDKFLFRKLPDRYGKTAWLFKNLGENKFLEKISSYREEKDSRFTHDGNLYDLNTLLSKSENLPINNANVSDLSWVLAYSKPDDLRVEKADLSAPVLIHNSNGREVVVDGLHRLTKAHNSGIKHLPYRRVTDEMLSSSLIKKSSFLLGATATHVAQNLATKAALKSGKISKYLANSFAEGAHGVVNTSIKARAARLLSGAVVPDLAVAHKTFHQLGNAMSPVLNSATKRQKVGLRMLSEGRFSDLQKYKLDKDPVIQAAQNKAKGVFKLPSSADLIDHAKKIVPMFEDKSHPLVSNILKNISRGAKPVGSKYKPGQLNSKLPMIGAGASLLADPAGGTLNTVKTLASSKTFGKTRIGSKINSMISDHLIKHPVESGINLGKLGKPISAIKHKLSGITINPVSAELKRTSAAITDGLKY